MSNDLNLNSVVIEIVQSYAPSGAVVEPDTHLVDDLMLDSMALVGILLQLEAQLGLRLDAGDISFDELQTPRILATVLAQKTGL